MDTKEKQAIVARLLAPFDPKEVKWKPAAVSGSRALAIAYVDARVVQDRLDEVLGIDNWQDNYKVLEDGAVVCRLRLRIGNEWITKVDVGSESEQGDAGDRRKAAFSDALKRAAVKFGIGRYLYRLPTQWVDYDPHRKQITGQPQLPPWAIPGGKAEKTRPAADKLSEQKPVSATVAEFINRVHDLDAELVKVGFPKGDFYREVLKKCRENNVCTELEKIPEGKIMGVYEWMHKRYETHHSHATQQQKARAS